MHSRIEGPRIIATATDRNYVDLAGVMLQSLMESSLPSGARLVVFCDDLKVRDKLDLERCLLGRADLEFIDIPKAQIARMGRLRSNSNWSRTIYSRLLMPQLLNINSGRILYLDADTLVLDSLEPLFSLDLDGHAIAAMGGANAKEAERLGLERDTAIFNSGVLVIDVEKWLDERLGEKALELAEEQFKNDLPSFDQDVLNIIMNGRFLKLDRRWNSFKSVEEKPVIVHFIHDKPNTTMCKDPWQQAYLRHRQQTPWANKRLKTKWDKRLRRLAFSFRVKTWLPFGGR